MQVNENLDRQQYCALSSSPQLPSEALVLFQQNIRTHLEKLVFDLDDLLDVCPHTHTLYPYDMIQALEEQLQVLHQEISLVGNKAKVYKLLVAP
ncbi:hypothetical protein [uncultured Microscilla sp.]|uniref:hypothetical protein n=1 Tax=uncultured Microscilla sp. TaxID=432653 RepID=UPI002603DAB1|nr:hypothetical protein [uncultured Microscilla sp.]